MAKCKKCGRDILWIETINGKFMPCDTKMVCFKEGKKDRLVTVNGEVISGEIIDTINGSKGLAYVPHWATCPHAEEFRRNGNEKNKDYEKQ